VVYYGRGDKVVEYFSELGMQCAPHYNPADFISTYSKESTCISEIAC